MNGQTDGTAPDLSAALEKLLSDPDAVAKAMEMAKKLSESADFSAIKGLMPSSQSGEENTNGSVAEEAPKSVRSVRSEDRIRLLCALKPYLSKRGAERIDTVISLSKLAEIAESLGIRLL